jgi:hypothetical protein
MVEIARKDDSWQKTRAGREPHLARHRPQRFDAAPQDWLPCG